MTYFFMIYYVLPTIFFVFLSYSTFWIDQNAAPARVATSTTAILVTLQHSISIFRYIPKINYATWLGNYIQGVMFFALAAIMEYGMVNYCSVVYNELRKKLDDLFERIIDKTKSSGQKE
jgi:hypothetical protein